MEGALIELAKQYAIDTANCKSRQECKSIRHIAKQWGLPDVTMRRYFSNLGYFGAGAKTVLSPEDEEDVVKTILQHANDGFCLNHAQVPMLMKMIYMC